MGCTAQDIIHIARGEVGYLEKKSNSQLDDKTANAGANNYTKYARDLYEAGYYGGRNKNGYAWCDTWTDWVAWMACGKDRKEAERITCQSGIYGAGCNWSAKYYRDKGRWFSSPKPGDQIFFGSVGSEYHTGWVVDVRNGKVYAVEGNTSGGSDVVANGGGVFEKSYNLNNAKIAGYGRPFYDDESETKPSSQPEAKPKEGDFDLNFRNLKNGTEGKDVKSLQILLMGYGYSLPKYGVDGDFGAETEKAVKSYQKDHNLEVDGVAGKNTMTSLLK